ncbi:RNA methyltransferase family protein [Artemisia annua]|uniref:RNA methyltransferase family protein n=1 Tax=Artemisia annua TaxID=35608 RepID=A0A2U1K8R2_ARTAN|nr:RNA methyltransferase family protein [Artemisia annua]
MAVISNITLRHLPHLTTKLQPSLRHPRYSSLNAVVSPIKHSNEPESTNDGNKRVMKGRRLFPKRGEEVELVCESLAFKGKGLCKVEETGYVVMCDRALSGERFVGRVTRKKNNYSEDIWLITI